MRQRFRCVECKLIFEGKRNTRGEVIPYDRSGSNPDDPIENAICFACSTGGVATVEIGDETADRLVSKIEDSGKITTSWRELVARADAKAKVGR
jgi:hypothetical protein